MDTDIVTYEVNTIVDHSILDECEWIVPSTIIITEDKKEMIRLNSEMIGEIEYQKVVIKLVYPYIYLKLTDRYEDIGVLVMINMETRKCEKIYDIEPDENIFTLGKNLGVGLSYINEYKFVVFAYGSGKIYEYEISDYVSDFDEDDVEFDFIHLAERISNEGYVYDDKLVFDYSS